MDLAAKINFVAISAIEFFMNRRTEPCLPSFRHPVIGSGLAGVQGAKSGEICHAAGLIDSPFTGAFNATIPWNATPGAEKALLVNDAGNSFDCGGELQLSSSSFS